MNINETTPWSEHYPYVRVCGPMHGEPRVLDAVAALYERAAYVSEDLHNLPYFIADPSSRGTAAALSSTFLRNYLRLRWFAQAEKNAAYGVRPTGNYAWKADPLSIQECCAWWGWFRQVTSPRAPKENEDGVSISLTVYAPTAATDASDDPRLGTSPNRFYLFLPGNCYFDWSADAPAVRQLSGLLENQNHWTIAYNASGYAEGALITPVWGDAQSIRDPNLTPYRALKLPDHFSGDSDAAFIPGTGAPFQHTALDAHFLQRLKNRVALLDYPYYVNFPPAFGHYESADDFAAHAQPGQAGIIGAFTGPDGKPYTTLTRSYLKITSGTATASPDWKAILAAVTEADAQESSYSNFWAQFRCALDCSVDVTYHPDKSFETTTRLRCTISRLILLYKPLFPADDAMFQSGTFTGLTLAASISERLPTNLPAIIKDTTQTLILARQQPNFYTLLSTARILAHSTDYYLFNTNPLHLISGHDTPNPILSTGAQISQEGIALANNTLTRLAECGPSATRPILTYTPPLPASEILPRLKDPTLYAMLQHRSRSGTAPTITTAIATINLSYDIRTLVEKHERPNWKHTL